MQQLTLALTLAAAAAAHAGDYVRQTSHRKDQPPTWQLYSDRDGHHYYFGGHSYVSYARDEVQVWSRVDSWDTLYELDCPVGWWRTIMDEVVPVSYDRPWKPIDPGTAMADLMDAVCGRKR